MKLSNTKIDTYKQCPRKYKLHYIDYIRPDYINSPLFFGLAIDEALNRLLLNKMAVDLMTQEQANSLKFSPEEIFDKNMEKYKLNGDFIVLKTSLRARYGKNDYNEYFLESHNIQELSDYLNKNNYEETDPIELRKLMIDCDYSELDNVDRVFLNMGNWFCLKNKGYEILRLYKQELFPKIKEVLEIQRTINLPETDNKGKETGRSITGKIDFRATFNDYEGVGTCDNKTSSQKYKKKAVEESQQLGIYIEETEDDWGAYFLITKNPKEIITKTCSKCKTKYNGGKILKCKECNEILTISKSYGLETQFLIGKPDSKILNEIFDDFIDIADEIEANNFPCNYSNNCFEYGQKCVYFDYCRNGNMNNLVNLKEKWKINS